MEIDLSKVVLLLLAILPGYVVRRGSDKVLPRSDRKPGATEEIAYFVVMSAVVHILLILLLFLLSIPAAWFAHRPPFADVSVWFCLNTLDLSQRMHGLPAGYCFLYFLASLLGGYFLGLFSGLCGVWPWREQLLLKLHLAESGLGRFWSRHFDRYMLSGTPILYKLLLPQLDEHGEERTVYAEIELRGGHGTITGRVISFSTQNDEEPHKLIYLRNVYKKENSAAQYQKLPADGLLLDLADALTVQVKQV